MTQAYYKDLWYIVARSGLKTLKRYRCKACNIWFIPAIGLCQLIRPILGSTFSSEKDKLKGTIPRLGRWGWGHPINLSPSGNILPRFGLLFLFNAQAWAFEWQYKSLHLPNRYFIKYKLNNYKITAFKFIQLKHLIAQTQNPY